MSCNCKNPPGKKGENSITRAIKKKIALLEFIDEKKEEGMDLFLNEKKKKTKIIKFRRKK